MLKYTECHPPGTAFDVLCVRSTDVVLLGLLCISSVAYLGGCIACACTTGGHKGAPKSDQKGRQKEEEEKKRKERKGKKKKMKGKGERKRKEKGKGDEKEKRGHKMEGKGKKNKKKR